MITYEDWFERQWPYRYFCPITISVWQFKDAPRALRDLATPFAAPPTNESVVVYVPASTSVGIALQLLSLPDEDHGETQITALPDGGHVLFAERP